MRFFRPLDGGDKRVLTIKAPFEEDLDFCMGSFRGGSEGVGDPRVPVVQVGTGGVLGELAGSPLNSSPSMRQRRSAILSDASSGSGVSVIFTRMPAGPDGLPALSVGDGAGVGFAGPAARATVTASTSARDKTAPKMVVFLNFITDRILSSVSFRPNV